MLTDQDLARIIKHFYEEESPVVADAMTADLLKLIAEMRKSQQEINKRKNTNK